MSDLAAQLYRRLCDQTRHNIESRRSLCEQSDRYKAERDDARAEVEMLRKAITIAAEAAYDEGYSDGRSEGFGEGYEAGAYGGLK